MRKGSERHASRHSDSQRRSSLFPAAANPGVCCGCSFRIVVRSEDTLAWTCLVFALCVGNLMFPIMIRLNRYYSRLTFPLNWLVGLLILAVVSFGTVLVA